MKCYVGTHHDTVGLSDGPEVDLLVIAAGDQHPARLVAQRQAVDIGAVGHKLLCGQTEREGVSQQWSQDGEVRSAVSRSTISGQRSVVSVIRQQFNSSMIAGSVVSSGCQWHYPR